jgi:hypothetical protein
MGPNIPDELYSVLEALKPALKSMDVRTFAVATPEEDWQNLITSVYLTENAVDEVKNQQERIPVLRNNEVALFSKAILVDYTLFQNIFDGEVKFPTPFGVNKVRFRKFDLTKLKVHSAQARISGSYKWILNATDVGGQAEREELWNIVKDNEIVARRLGFQDICTLIKNRLQIEYGNGYQKDFELVVPSLASIENAYFVNSRFEVKVKKASSLKDLQLNLTLERDNIPIWTEPRKLKDEKPETLQTSIIVTEALDLRGVLPHDFMNVELILGESALTLDRKGMYAPLENAVEPFLKTLDAFCSLQKLESMLLEPYQYKKTGKIFENSVTWLLSLAGYNPIYLGKNFEKCRTKTQFEVGSADIIAYEENKRILLMDCDTGPMDPRKIQQLIELGKYFSESFKEYRGLEIIPVLVTPKDYRGQPMKGVRIVDCESLKKILEELSKGNRERARNIFCEFGY